MRRIERLRLWSTGIALGLGVSGCADRFELTTPPSAIGEVTRGVSQTYLAPGERVPPGKVLVAIPEPYSPAKHGVLSGFDPAGNRAHDPLWQPPPARKTGPVLELPSDPPAPCSDCWHESKGWWIHQGRGVYARVDVQRNFTIKTGDVNVSVYAPTHYPAGGACLEATVMHYRTTGNPNGPTSNFFGFWDWCERNDLGGWGYAADMDATGWRSAYVRSIVHSDGVGQEEAAFFQVYATNAQAAPGTFDCWRGLLWNFNTGTWNLVITRCGPNQNHVYYPGNNGWSIWEDYNMSFYGCADYDHPGISAENIQYYTTAGTWSTVADAGVKSSLNSGGSGFCWSSGTFTFHEHLTDMWHGHTYADRQ